MANQTEFSLWTVDPLVKVLRNSAKPETAGKKISIKAVRNEYESGQFVVAASDRIEKLAVKVGEISGPSGVKPRVEVRFVGFVEVKKGTIDTPPEHIAFKAPADAPDPLLDVKQVSVEAGMNQPVWVTVYVPENAEPGIYSGSIEVDADGEKASVPFEIKVHPFTLPDDRTLYLTNWFNPNNIAKSHGLEAWSEPFWKMLESYARFMADYRQNVVITPIMTLIKGKDDGKGNLTWDFSLFDRWVELFKKAGVLGTIEGAHLGGRGEWEAKDFDANRPTIYNADGSVKPNPSVKVTSEDERIFLSQFLPALQDHLEKKGWLKEYVQHLCDEPIPANAESYKKLASYVRQYAPKIRIIDACMTNDIAGSIDIWVPLTDQFDRDFAFFKERQKQGDQVWFYTCLAPKGKYMNRFIDYPLIDTRLIHWMNFKYGVEGYLHWGFNYWQGDPFKDLEPDWGGDTYLPPGDSHIVYPGKRGPLSSVRLEALRDGVEDYELLKLLEKKNPKKAREIADTVVKSFTEYTFDPAVLGEARTKIIDALCRPDAPKIQKLGTIDCDMVETTPIVFKGKLYRFEYVRKNYKPNTTGDSYFRFIDTAAGKPTPSFAAGYHLGSAHVEGDTVYVYGVKGWGESSIEVFWSKDLTNWKSETALSIPGWGIYNNSVCKGKDGYRMAIELGEPPEEVGVRFTMRFARSDDLIHWQVMLKDCVFSRDRYTACPALRYLDGYYYMIYLEERPGPAYEPHIVRSRDFVNWESSPLNPVMQFSEEDKNIANPKLTSEQKEHIAKAVNLNNSDVDLCEFKGKTVIYYSWGNQQGIEFLSEAEYNGKLDTFLRSFFPKER